MYQWQDMLGKVKAVLRAWRYRYYLATLIILCGGLIGLVCIAGFLYLLHSSIDSDRQAIQAQATADLQRISAQLQTEAGRVLLDPTNASTFAQKNRDLIPIVLPRQHYVPRQASVSGRVGEPPSSCFVWLEATSKEGSAVKQEKNVRFCSYISSQRVSGLWLYFVMSLPTEKITPHDVGDLNFSSVDTVEVKLQHRGKDYPLKISFQLPKINVRNGQFELAAYADLKERRVVPLKGDLFQGWAYVTKDPITGLQATMLTARVAYRLLDPEANPKNSEFPWPPVTGTTSISLVAWSKPSDEMNGSTSTFTATRGESTMSFPSLAEGFARTRGTITVFQEEGGQRYSRIWSNVQQNSNPTAVYRTTQEGKESGGSFAFPKTIIVREEIPGSKFRLELAATTGRSEPALRSAAIIILLLILLALGYVTLTYRKLLSPIRGLSSKAQMISKNPLGSTEKLNDDKRIDEIGALVIAFNEVLEGSRKQAARVLEERARRESESRKRLEEEVNRRLANLKTIGHEIRSPLQALLSMHEAGEPSYRYLERMRRAIQFLFGAASPEDAFAGMPLSPEVIDLVVFLTDVSTNAHLDDVDNVKFVNSVVTAKANVDVSALEDAVGHVLSNANRCRNIGTPITIGLSVNEVNAIISISNQGPSIDPEKMDTIFDYGVSLYPDSSNSNQGQGLFVVRNYLRRMFGDISVENIDDGVTFRLTVPLFNQFPQSTSKS